MIKMLSWNKKKIQISAVRESVCRIWTLRSWYAEPVWCDIDGRRGDWRRGRQKGNKKKKRTVVQYLPGTRKKGYLAQVWA